MTEEGKYRDPLARREYTLSEQPEFADFALPGRGAAKETCGKWAYDACFAVVHKNKVPLRRFQLTCGRRDCPVCWEDWAVEQAQEITRRVWEGSKILKRGKPVHGILSPPPGILEERCTVEDYRKLRTMAYETLKHIGYVHGGALIFHPWRCKDEKGNAIGGQFLQANGIPVWGPHFHYLGPGWNIEGRVKMMYEETGWVYKRKRVLYNEKAVYGVAHYLLTHCGVSEYTHSYTWFADFSYASELSALIGDAPERPEDRCKCGAKWCPVIWVGDGPPPTFLDDEAILVDPRNLVVDTSRVFTNDQENLQLQAMKRPDMFDAMLSRMRVRWAQRLNTSDVIIKTDLSNGGV